MADALTAFGELGEELPERLTEDGVVLDGWLLALDDGGWLDTDLLRRRLAGELGAGRPGFVASDLLWSDGAPWHARRFATRREHLASVLRDGDRCVVSHALRGEGTLLAEALGRFGLTGISARRLDARYRFGAAGEGWLRLPIAPAVRTERPRLALIQRLPLDEPRLGKRPLEDPGVWRARAEPLCRADESIGRIGPERRDVERSGPGTETGASRSGNGPPRTTSAIASS